MEKSEQDEGWRSLTGQWRIGRHAVFDAERRTLAAENQKVSCTPQVADILAFLIASDGHWATHDELANAAWKNGAVSPAGINSAIKRVRDALGDDGVYLESASRGHSAYELKAVERLGGTENLTRSQTVPLVDEETVPEAEARTKPDSASVRVSNRRQTGTTVGYTAAAVIAVVAIGGGAMGLMSVFDTRDAASPGVEKQSYAQMPVSVESDPAAPGNAHVQYGAISTLRWNMFNDPNVSADWLSRVVSGNSSYLDPTTRAGVAYADGLHAYAKGNYERARQRIETALEAAPDTPDYKAGLVAVEAAAGNRAAAKAHLEKLNNATLKYPAPTRLAAELRYLTHTADSRPAQERLDAFDDLLNRMTPVFAGNSTAVAGALVGRANALAALDRWDEAYTAFQDALAITQKFPYHWSTWWGRTLIAPLARAAGHAGHCGRQIDRLEGSLQIPTLGNKYNTMDAAIAIETVRCLDALGREDAAPYLKALRIAGQNGVLTESQRTSLAEISAAASA
ncbi:regulatory protein [Salinisphaera sp. C84B14]|uniref:winged helix-turn-helix domain-containing protein n=1 Tax=Salinisphaera sp. C84B14 TaxID=1304155 RepID=UPI0033409A2F